jgi:POT family proton-dependent oligopeptide transporter
MNIKTILNEKIKIDPNKYPRGLFILSFVEMWERFSFYGMRSLLTLFLTNKLLLSDSQSYGMFGVYASLVWGIPIFGGYIADKILGFQKAILIGSIIITTGHLTLAVFNGKYALLIGLGLIISGTGFFKSNISGLIGQLYPKNSPHRSTGFTIFYIFINIGGFFAPLVCGLVGDLYGWHAAFSLAGFGMLIGVFVLFTQRKSFKDVGLPPLKYKNNNKVVFQIFLGGMLISPLFSFIIYNYETFQSILPLSGVIFVLFLLKESKSCSPKEKVHIKIILLSMFMIMLSGAFIEQSATSINLCIDRNVNRSIFNYHIPTASFQSIDPLTVLLFGPIITGIWSYYIQKKQEISPGVKFFLAFLCVFISYCILYMGCVYHDENNKISLSFILVGMVILSLADIFIYPLVLSMCSQLSPKHLQGLLMGGVMLSISLSQIFGSLLASLAAIPKDNNMSNAVNDLISLEVYSKLFFHQSILAFFALIFVIYLGRKINYYVDSLDKN